MCAYCAHTATDEPCAHNMRIQVFSSLDRSQNLYCVCAHMCTHTPTNSTLQRKKKKSGQICRDVNSIHTPMGLGLGRSASPVSFFGAAVAQLGRAQEEEVKRGLRRRYKGSLTIPISLSESAGSSPACRFFAGNVLPMSNPVVFAVPGDPSSVAEVLGRHRKQADGFDSRPPHLPMNQTLYDSAEDEDSKPENTGSAGDLPIFANGSIGAAAWANEDQNGNYYLSIQVPLLDRFNLFVPDEYKAAFNEFVQHIQDGGGS